MAKYIQNDTGICPFCKRRINITYTNVLNLAYRKDLQSRENLEKINTGRCIFCDEVYRYETEVFAFDLKNKYAIIVNKEGNENYYSHLHSDIYRLAFGENYRLRYVTTYLEMIEKVLLFNSGLDDKVIEISKHIHFADIMGNLNEHHRFLVTDISESTLTFTLYDDHDKMVQTEKLDISKLNDIHVKCESNISEFANYKNIDNKWAKEYLNGGRIND